MVKLISISLGILTLSSTKLQRKIIPLTVDPTGVIGELPDELTVESAEYIITVDI